MLILQSVMMLILNTLILLTVSELLVIVLPFLTCRASVHIPNWRIIFPDIESVEL